MRSWGVVLVLGLVLGALPGTSGQSPFEDPQVEIEVAESDSYMAPEGGTQRQANVTFTCAPGVVPSAQGIPVELSAAPMSEEQNVSARFTPSTVYFQLDAQDCANAIATTQMVNLTISVDKVLPFAQAFTFEAVATHEEYEARTTWREHVGPAFSWSSAFPEKKWQAGQNERLSVPLTSINGGNGDLRVTFRIADNTSDELSAALPGPQVVPSTVAGHATDRLVVPIDIQTPFRNGYMDETFTFAVMVAAEAADEPGVAAGQQVDNITIHVVGSYVPGPSAAPIIVVGVLAAMWAGRRIRGPRLRD